jgi:glycosyltransferase involved in cell wall biosynthesis
MDLISVIIPVYNVEKYLAKCVSSVINQQYQNLEIILVDDGSTDNSADICDTFARENENVKVIHTENHGVSSARKAGILASSGKYITFIDSDDFIDERMYKYLHDLITSGDFQIACCTYQLAYDDTVIKPDNDKETIKEYTFPDLIKNLYEDDLWSLCTKLYAKDLFDKVDELSSNLSVSEDLLLNYKLFKNCKNAIVSNKKLYYYFRHSDSVMAKSIHKKRIQDSMKSYQLIAQDMDKNSLAYSYHIANMINNDFLMLMQIVKQNTCYDCYDEVRDEILKYKKFVFKKENKFAFNYKHKIATILLLVTPKICNIFLKIK